jgi:glycosyltransferase involved in cell wall biosynthesis
MSAQVGFRIERIHVIRNGVDLGRFDNSTRAASRAALGLRPDELVLGTVGRLVPVKDQATMLRAFAILKAAGLAFTALIAGTGPLREQLESLAAILKLDNVRFLGNRDDVPQVLAAMDIFVLSSESEGLSNTIQEAMATGLAVVATHVGGADELVDHERTGLLVPPHDPQKIAEAIGLLVRNAAWRQNLATAAAEKARREFGIDRMLQEYERMYLDVGTQTGEVVGCVRPHEA